MFDVLYRRRAGSRGPLSGTTSRLYAYRARLTRRTPQIDRKNDYYWIQGLHFPKTADDFASFHTNTIIDGELVIDTKPDGREILKYLVFDCLLLDGQSLVQRPLDKRLGVWLSKYTVPEKPSVC